MTAVFIFHRDLRIEDNTSLFQAIDDGYKIMPVFCFPPEQIDPRANPIFSNPAVQFMCESLADLDASLHTFHAKLHMYRGNYADILRDIYHKTRFAAVYSNRDESVYARERDAQIAAWCEAHSVAFVQKEDYGLVPLSEGLLKDGRPYSVLAQYFARFDKDVHVPVVKKKKVNSQNFVATNLGKELSFRDVDAFYVRNEQIKTKGGRKHGVALLKRIQQFHAYETERDLPYKDATTRASAYLKFGCFSIREMYWTVVKKFGPHHGLIRELVFRDFYYKLYSLHPKLQRGTAYRDTMDKMIPWISPTSKEGKLRWKAWVTCATGIPFVDAGMRQLYAEGWMHNRVRMIVASFVTRHLRLDWRECSKYFYKHLVDADPFSNTAGWQWAAGIGVDSAPYFRAPFNPFRQSYRFDKDGLYIKKWIPALAEVMPRDLHRWEEPTVRTKYDVEYPAPIVDVKGASFSSVAIWKKASK